MNDFTHFDEGGRARMVDVGAKDATKRSATAMARVRVNEETYHLIETGGTKKGDVLSTAQLAGIFGAKRTSDLIPLCHNLPLSGVSVELHLNADECAVDILATAECVGPTGVEMEALTAASVAALTVYDMCKAVQRDIVIERVCLLRKSGGKSGLFERKDV
ncbi:MAG: cyclic pyranopterin monophosphate synthase MoaC [Oscillospiraceae bacterium]|nr:cyclic pyranopterin monophosphate synthase MoaC [Oscillospiraceae bacterium]